MLLIMVEMILFEVRLSVEVVKLTGNLLKMDVRGLNCRPESGIFPSIYAQNLQVHESE